MDPLHAAPDGEFHLQAIIGKGVDFSLCDSLIAQVFFIIVCLLRLGQFPVHSGFDSAPLIDADNHHRAVQLRCVRDASARPGCREQGQAEYADEQKAESCFFQTITPRRFESPDLYLYRTIIHYHCTITLFPRL